ncbi:RNA polymerase sigma factor [Amycolatopsis suaedae]|uniref:Sigma-70 family RNA polymerase sigma factor n=1 Tax=Amycolatopsis suaedae TaxID=2510978 RepID=A0A4Q7JFA9_9PSEU|nr:sigma-70 family RNA polymerase sigma factor [Amycolatopsis suaedae]RZQ65224.1 sigma-70 family RNA polymerase sigma factor [Amycolatopsis suaedae]
MTDARTTTKVPAWEGLEGAELHAACLRAAQAGDRRALNRLVAELLPLVWHVARSYRLDQHTAEDVVQTVWLSLFRHLDQLREPRALAGWLITTTRREAARPHGRRTQPLPLSDELAETVPSSLPTPEAAAVKADRDRRIWTAFAQLTDKCQELIRLTVLAGRAEYQLVAEALRMPRGSIGPTRGRCLNTLRDLLAAEGGS